MLSQPLKLLFPLCFLMLAEAQTCDIPVQFHFSWFLPKRKVGKRTSHFHIIWLQIFRIRRYIFAVLSNWCYCTHPSMCLLSVLLVELTFWPIDHLPLPWCNIQLVWKREHSLRFFLRAPNNIYSQTDRIHAQCDLMLNLGCLWQQ